MKAPATDPQQRFLELLRKYPWNKAVQLLKEELKAAIGKMKDRTLGRRNEY